MMGTLLPQNMGNNDRMIRLILGTAMLTCGLMNKKPTQVFNTLSNIVGAAFIMYGVTGWDPLLYLFKTTTKPEDPNNVIKKITHASANKDARNVDNAQQQEEENVSTASDSI